MSRESSNLTPSTSVPPYPKVHYTCSIPHPVRHFFFHSASSLRSHLCSAEVSTLSVGYSSTHPGGLRATDQMISLVVGPDDIDSIAPPDFARSSGLHSKCTGGALRARPSTASLCPGGSIAEGGGSPYGGSTYSGVSSNTSSSVGSPMPPYSPYSPFSAPPPLSGRRSPSGGIGTGSFPCTHAAGLWSSPGLFSSVSTPAPAALRMPVMVATLGLPAPGLWYTCVWIFPAYAALAFEWACGSVYAEEHGEEG